MHHQTHPTIYLSTTSLLKKIQEKTLSMTRKNKNNSILVTSMQNVRSPAPQKKDKDQVTFFEKRYQDVFCSSSRRSHLIFLWSFKKTHISSPSPRHHIQNSIDFKHHEPQVTTIPIYIQHSFFDRRQTIAVLSVRYPIHTVKSPR